MQEEYIFSLHAGFKFLILVVGFTTAVHSFYDSYDTPWERRRLGEICHEFKRQGVGLMNWTVGDRFSYVMTTGNCLSIGLERVFLWINIFYVLMATLSLYICCNAEIENVNAARRREAIYHYIAGILLLTFSASLLMSELEFKKNHCKVVDLVTQEAIQNKNSNSCAEYIILDRNILSSALGLANAVLYIVTGVIIQKVNFPGVLAPGTHTTEGHSDRARRRTESISIVARSERNSRSSVNRLPIVLPNVRKHTPLAKPQPGASRKDQPDEDYVDD